MVFNKMLRAFAVGVVLLAICVAYEQRRRNGPSGSDGAKEKGCPDAPRIREPKRSASVLEILGGTRFNQQTGSESGVDERNQKPARVRPGPTSRLEDRHPRGGQYVSCRAEGAVCAVPRHAAAGKATTRKKTDTLGASHTQADSFDQSSPPPGQS